GHTVTPEFFDCGQYAQLVVHQDIVLSRVTPLDIIQRLFLVDVNQHVTLYRFEDAGAFDLARLKDHVAVRQDDRLSPRAKFFQHVERSGIQTIGEGVVDQERRHRQQVNILRMLDPVALQGAEVIAIAQIGKQLFEDRPVALAGGNSELTVEVALDVVLDAVVVDQRIVYVDEKND